MDSRKIDCPRRGGIYRFIQTYESDIPKVICFKRNDNLSLEEDCLDFFIKDFCENLSEKAFKYEYDLAGGGEIAIGKNQEGGDIVYNIWNKSPKEDFRIDQEHVKDYYEIKKRKLELK